MFAWVNTAFGSAFGLCNVVVEQDFHAAAQAPYSSHPMSYTKEQADFVPLFFGVIALGLLHGSTALHEFEQQGHLKER